MSRKRADILIGQKSRESKKRTETNGIMEQLLKKKSRRENRDDNMEPTPSSTLSDLITSPSRPPLPAPPRTPPQHTQSQLTNVNVTSVPSSSTRSRRSGKLTITNMFDMPPQGVKY